MTKKLLSLLLVGLMVLALAPMGAFAKAESRKVLPDTAAKFVPTKANDVATRDEIINDGSILNESFEAASFPTGWWTFDKDGDGVIWAPIANFAYEGDYCARSVSYLSGTSYNSDNWLMTPEFVPTAGTYLSFYAKSQDPSYPDDMQVLIAQKGSGAYNTAHTAVVESKWTTLLPLTTMAGTYTQYSYDLSAYADKTMTVAFRHVSSDMFYLCLDKVQVGNAEDAIMETSITVEPTTLTLEIGATSQLAATIAPTDATFQEVTWSSSDNSVVGVNAIGGVIGLAEGTATVTATSHSGLTATCTVTVSGGYEFSDDMIAYGVSATTWYGMDHYGYLTANQVDADSSFIIRAEYNALDGLVYGYRSGSTSGTYEFCSFDPANSYAATVIATVTDIPMWMAYGFDTGAMYACYWTDDGTNYTGVQICELDLTTGLAGDLVVDTYTATWEEDGESGQYYLMPMIATYVGDGYFVAYDYNYQSIVAYDTMSDAFNAFIIANNIADQVGSDVQTYVQKMYYNPVDGYLYWAGVFENLDLVVIDLSTGIMVPVGPTATDSQYDELTLLYAEYYYVTFVDGVTDEVISTQIVGKGDDAVAPDAPEHDGYTFDHWDGTMTGITEHTTITAVYTENAPAGLPGDVDCNGEVTMADVTILAMYLNGENPEITEQGMINADANQDGTVDIRDIAAIYAIISAS